MERYATQKLTMQQECKKCEPSERAPPSLLTLAGGRADGWMGGWADGWMGEWVGGWAGGGMCGTVWFNVYVSAFMA